VTMSLQLPHWLMIGGAVLVAAGSVGLARRKTKVVQGDSEPTETSREPMPPLPALLDSKRKPVEGKTGPPKGPGERPGGAVSTRRA
jgi:hypothetical protein